MERIFPTFSYDLGDLPPSSGAPRTWFDARSGHAPVVGLPVMIAGAATLARTADGNAASVGPGTVRALFVNGPTGVARHLLAAGAVTIGRGPGVDIVVDDLCVSRVHARLDAGDGMTLTDLGSSNGTTLGDARLPTGEPRPLLTAEPFFVGRSALVVHAVPAPRDPFRRLSSTSEIGAHLRTHRHEQREAGATFTIIRVTRAPGTAPAVVETILAAVARSPHDWSSWLDPHRLLLGIEVASPAEANAVERAAIRQLASWGVWAEVDIVPLPPPSEPVGDSELGALLAGHATVRLKRGQMVVRDPAMHELLRAARRVASADVSVLVLGETGSGKDVLASMVHELSARGERPFLGINCASLPEALLESELFGHERGAFTGAVATKPGLLETANGGTVFLDEVGDLPASLQAKLLRVIESREVTRVGAVRSRLVDVRFIAATNRNIAAAVATGQFRQDLLYRLNCVTLSVPPLRERPTEIEPLVRLFLADARARFRSQVTDISQGALDALMAHPWPGNVRELRNVVERAVLLAPGHVIEPGHLGLSRPTVMIAPLPAADSPTPPTPAPVTSTATRSERDAIAEALVACGGNQSRAAKFLGVSRRTLVRQIARLGLPRPRGAGPS